MKSFLSRFGFRSIEQSGVDTPPTGQRALFAKSDGWYDLDDTGAETQLGAGGSGVTSVNADTGPAVVLDAADVGAVPTTRTVNGQALSSDITISTASGMAAFWGDGSDGNVTISGTTTLTTDMFYNTLTVQSGGILKTNGYRVYCKTALIVDSGGKVHFDGNSASAATPGSAVSPGSTDGSVAGSATNGSGVGTNTSNQSAGAFGGRGGNGGAGSGGAGGVSGTIPSPTSVIGGRFPKALPQLATGQLSQAQTLGGGTAGASGGGTSVSGGAGGAAGGVMVINAKSVTNNGTISANGGAGGTMPSGNKGGGGGGGGGVVVINCESFTGTTPTATGGALGAGVGTGVNGTAGANGTVFVGTWL